MEQGAGQAKDQLLDRKLLSQQHLTDVLRFLILGQRQKPSPDSHFLLFVFTFLIYLPDFRHEVHRKFVLFDLLEPITQDFAFVLQLCKF